MFPQMVRDEPVAPMPDDDDKISIGEAAVMCGVHYDTILRWIAKGVMPCEVVGPNQTKRVRRSDVRAQIRPLS